MKGGAPARTGATASFNSKSAEAYTDSACHVKSGQPGGNPGPEALTQMGFSLIPLSTKPADARKRPPKKSSWKRYQFKGTTLEQVQEWGKRYPGCGWAVLLGQPSGIVALDVDSDDGLEWVDWSWGCLRPVARGLQRTLRSDLMVGLFPRGQAHVTR